MQYRYAARTLAGDRVRGSLTATDRDAALAGLHGRALFITHLEPQRPWNVDLHLPRLPGAPTSRSRVIFFRSFATLIRSGVPMRHALNVTVERTNDEALRTTIRTIVAEIERGDQLSVALARRPRIFPRLVIAMIAAGEAGGILDEVLERVAAILERDHALRVSVVSALAYPATVLIASLGLVVFLIVRIVPMFADLFASFHTDLPASTRAFLWLGSALARPPVWIFAVVSIAFCGFAVPAMRSSPRGAFLLDRLRLSIPFVGKLLAASIHARFARMLATLVASGVELTLAIEVVMPVMASPVHARALQRVAAAIREGEAITPPLAAAGVFDPMLVALMSVGEESGTLDVMLAKGADYFEADLASTIATLGAIVEPAFIVVLGALVGCIVYSVYIPLYSLIGSIAK